MCYTPERVSFLTAFIIRFVNLTHLMPHFPQRKKDKMMMMKIYTKNGGEHTPGLLRGSASICISCLCNYKHIV